jgi:hypothetical protein
MNESFKVGNMIWNVLKQRMEKSKILFSELWFWKADNEVFYFLLSIYIGWTERFVGNNLVVHASSAPRYAPGAATLGMISTQVNEGAHQLSNQLSKLMHIKT